MIETSLSIDAMTMKLVMAGTGLPQFGVAFGCLYLDTNTGDWYTADPTTRAWTLAPLVRVIMLSAFNPATARTRQMIFNNLAVSPTNTDVQMITGLPGKYRLQSLIAFGASQNLAPLKTGLFTAPNGSGVAIAPSQSIVMGNGTVIYQFSSLINGSLQTAPILYYRVTGAGPVAASHSIMLEIVDLS